MCGCILSQSLYQECYDISIMQSIEFHWSTLGVNLALCPGSGRNFLSGITDYGKISWSLAFFGFLP